MQMLKVAMKWQKVLFYLVVFTCFVRKLKFRESNLSKKKKERSEI